MNRKEIMDQILSRVSESDKEAFVTDIRKAKNFEERLLILEKYKLNLTDDETKAWQNAAANEISDDELDMAAGGCCNCKGCSCGCQITTH